MRRVQILLAALCVVLLAACGDKQGSQASPDANLPHANVQMRDGTSVSGTVTSSTPSEITLNMDSGGSRTLLMKDVKSVDYGDAAANAPGTAPATASARAA